MNWLNPSHSFKAWADRPTGRQTVHKPTFDLVVTKKTAMMNSIIGDARSIRYSGCRMAAVIGPNTPCRARSIRYSGCRLAAVIRPTTLWAAPDMRGAMTASWSFTISVMKASYHHQEQGWT